MAVGTTFLTRTLDRAIAVIARQSGIGFQVTNKALTTNVATLTTNSAHGFAAGNRVVVRGVDTTFDGEHDIVSVPTATTFTYAKTAGDVASVAVVTIAGCSTRISPGYRAFKGSESWATVVQALTAESQGWFDIDIARLKIAENEVTPARFKGALYFNCPRGTSKNLNAAYDMAIGIAGELVNRSNYSAGEAAAREIEFSRVQVEQFAEMGIEVIDFGNYGQGGMIFPDPL